MRSNLAKLENRRQNLGIDPASASRQKAALLSQLGANNCGPQYAGYAPQQRGFFARLFNPQPAIQPVAVPSGGLTELRPQTRRTASASSGDYDVGFGRGAYRTLCVRTCDGYYFPIHYSANRSTFATDEQICRQMCPGTDVALYAHRNPGQDASQALSTTDETRYTDLPNAFAYRTTFNPSCTCGKATLSDAVAGGYTPADISTFAQASPPLPATAPTLGEDPETIANRNGQLDPVEIGKPNVAAPIASLSLPSGGAVRRVGPSYYYAQ
jgi:hypothetical protein